MKFYIASPFFTEEQLKTVVDIERTLFLIGEEYYSPRCEGTIKNMTVEEKENKMEAIYNANVFNIAACEGMICVLDWPDTGTIFELGYAARMRQMSYQHRRKIISYSNVEKPVNVMLRYAVDAHALGVDSLVEIMYDIRKEREIQNKNFQPVNE